MKQQRFDIHQHITNQIIAAIESGAGEFRLPWHRSAGNIMRPVNIASKNAYRGVNILTLWAAADASGYSSGTWGTYKQWAEAGAQVRKGEKAAYVVFYKELTVAAEDSDEAETRLFARATPVFAAEQADGYGLPTVEGPTTTFSPIEAAEVLVAKTGAIVNHGGNRAYYRPSTDSIQLPQRELFIGTETISPAESYYAVLLHELTHWTSPEKRCNRELGKRFGDDAYAMEELVAELGAAFLCADLGITGEPRIDHAQIWIAGCASSRPTRRPSSRHLRRRLRPWRSSPPCRARERSLRSRAFRCRVRTAQRTLLSWFGAPLLRCVNLSSPPLPAPSRVGMAG